jgi:hypothetical protein
MPWLVLNNDGEEEASKILGLFLRIHSRFRSVSDHITVQSSVTREVGVKRRKYNASEVTVG